MKRLLVLAVVMGLFYVSMTSFSSAHQKAKAPVQADATQQKPAEQDEYADYDRDDLKTGLVRAFYDVLMSARDDIENNEGDNDLGEYKGRDGKNHTIFDEARRTMLQADRIFAQAKEDNKRALVKLRNPPRRILPGQVITPKVIVPNDKKVLNQQIEAQQKLVKREQQKLEILKKELVATPAKSTAK